MATTSTPCCWPPQRRGSLRYFCSGSAPNQGPAAPSQPCLCWKEPPLYPEAAREAIPHGESQPRPSHPISDCQRSEAGYKKMERPSAHFQLSEPKSSKFSCHTSPKLLLPSTQGAAIFPSEGLFGLRGLCCCPISSLTCSMGPAALVSCSVLGMGLSSACLTPVPAAKGGLATGAATLRGQPSSLSICTAPGALASGSAC